LRFDQLKTIWNTRSHCPACKKEIPWYDLVPLFSYFILWGKCRSCGKSISIQYPLVEALTALIFVGLYWHFGFSWELIPYILISGILIVALTYDILHYLVADILVWIALGIWIVWLIIQLIINNYEFSVILNSLYGAVALGGFLALIVLISREKWMGAGDIGLGILLGAVMGWPNVLVGSFAAFLLGSIVGIILIILKKKNMKDRLPFAPFLILGTFITIFWGERIINWYLGGF